MIDNVKIKKQELDEQNVVQKKEEVEETMHKISALHSIKERQERERRDFVRKQQD